MGLTGIEDTAPGGEHGAIGAGQVLLRGAEATAERGEHLLHVYQLADPMLAELALEPLLHELLERVKQILDVDTVAVLLIDEAERELVARAAKGIEEEVEQGVRLPIGGGFAGRIAARRAPIFIADVDHADVLNPILREKGIRSLLGVPLIVEGACVGVLHVGSLEPREFDEHDVALLQLAAGRAAPAIERARLFDALDREHRSAVALQRSLLPDRLPEIPGVEVAARYLPARDEVGGDWYDVIELPRGRIGIAIGDVAGHGVRAAAIMGQLRTALRAYALDGHGPGETLKRVGRLLHTIRGQAMATAAYAIMEHETGAVRLASAGHPPGLIVSPEGEARMIDVRSAPPLGTLHYPTFHETSLHLEPGTSLLLYTDGLIERRNEALTVGMERLRQAASVVTSADALCTRVLETLVPPLGAADDVALVSLRSQLLTPKMVLRLPADPQVLVQVRQALRRWLVAFGATQADVAALTLALGESCANAIEHAYAPSRAGFEVEAAHADGVVTLSVRDRGRWRTPRGANRGRGLTIIESMVDDVDVRATATGTEIVMRRRLGQ